MADRISNEALRRFQQATGADAETARRYMEGSGGNLQAAVAAFRRAEGYREQRPEAPLLPPAQPAEAREGGPEHRGVVGVVGALLYSPFRAIRALAESSLREPDESLLARDFVRSYEYNYGMQHPDFAELGWKEAARLAEQQSKFLFAYVHSPQHQDTEGFCRQVLSSNQIVTFLNQNFVCWGGSIHCSPAFVVQTPEHSSGATTFPFMCVMNHMASQIKIVASVQGQVSAAHLLNILQQSIEEQGAVLVAQRAQRRQRELDRQLRRDQDMEYQRALEADRERERRNREAAAVQAAREEEARQQAEEERLAEEAELQRRQNRREAMLQRQREKQATLKPEPAQTNNVAQIRIRLPDGSTYNRKFLDTDKVQEVYDFVDSLENLHCWDYTLASSYPKVEFNLATRNRSLAEMGVEHRYYVFLNQLQHAQKLLLHVKKYINHKNT